MLPNFASLPVLPLTRSAPALPDAALQHPGDIVAFKQERQLAPLPVARVQDRLQADPVTGSGVRLPQKLPASSVSAGRGGRDASLLC